MDILTATPVEIDTALAEIWAHFYRAYDKLDAARARLAGYRRQARHGSSYAADAIPAAETAVNEAESAANAVLDAARPYDMEFARRGGWNRAYLVDTPAGHVHRTRECPTCNKGRTLTRFHWLVEFSGCTERKIVMRAGSMACTTCYPSAPIDVLARAPRIDRPSQHAKVHHG